MLSKKNKIISAIVIAGLSAFGLIQNTSNSSTQKEVTSHNKSSQFSSVETAYQKKQSDIQVEGSGVVVKTLRDDNEGHRHQKFILRLNTNRTILIAHNIDLAPRINSLKKGDKVAFNGEYEFNSRGGVVHWTHHDPKKHHLDGWLKHNSKTYQ